MEEKIKWGVLGAAKIAINKAIPGIANAVNSQFSAIASRNSKNFDDSFKEYEDLNIYDSYEKLLEDTTIDAVYIPLPNHLHFEWVKRSVLSGKHVLCEKPMVLSLRDCEELIDLQNSSGKLISEAFMVRYHPRWQELKNKLDSGEYGKPSLIQAAFTYDNPDPNNIRNAYQEGGGGMWDIGCYPVQLSRFLFGREPLEVSSHLKTDQNFKVDTLASGVLDFGDAQTIFQVGTNYFRTQFMRLITDQCSINIPLPFNPDEKKESYFTVHYDQDPDENFLKVEQPFRDQFTLQFEHFSSAILNNTNPLVTLEDTLENTRVLLALFESGKTGKRVKLR